LSGRAAKGAGDRPVIASVAYGSLLGVFHAGRSHRRASESGAMVGMVCGFILNIFLWQFTGFRIPVRAAGQHCHVYYRLRRQLLLRRTMPVEPVAEVRA